MTHPLIPDEMIDRAARIIDKFAFATDHVLSDLARQKRQATAKRKAAVILRIWTIAAVDPGSPNYQYGSGGFEPEATHGGIRKAGQQGDNVTLSGHGNSATYTRLRSGYLRLDRTLGK